MTLLPTERAAVLALAGHHARNAVRVGLGFCTYCNRVRDCRTASGRKCRPHKGVAA